MILCFLNTVWYLSVIHARYLPSVSYHAVLSEDLLPILLRSSRCEQPSFKKLRLTVDCLSPPSDFVGVGLDPESRTEIEQSPSNVEFGSLDLTSLLDCIWLRRLSSLFLKLVTMTRV